MMRNCSVGMIGGEMRGSPRMNVESIAVPIDCSLRGIRRVAVIGREKEIGIGTEGLVVQSKEGIMCVLLMKSVPGIELTGREVAYGGRRIPRVCCLCASFGFSMRRETV
jgi:hypothetical protein